MKKIIIAIIVLLIIAGGYVFFNQNKFTSSSLGMGGCVITENRGEAVPVGVTQAVAQKQQNANNKPFNWVPVGYYPIYSSSGLINYYAFIFRKSDFTKFTTLSGLEQNASMYSESSSDINDKYQFNDVGTVWTGSTDGRKLIFRHYTGIPEIIAKKVQIKKFIEDTYGDKTIGNIVADSEAGKISFDIVYKSTNKATGDVVGLDNSIVSKSELVRNQKEIENRMTERYSRLETRECDLYQQAVTEGEAAHRKQWTEVTGN